MLVWGRSYSGYFGDRVSSADAGAGRGAMNAIELIPAKRIVPVVVISDAAHAVPLAGVASRFRGSSLSRSRYALVLRVDAIAALARSSVNIKVGAGSGRDSRRINLRAVRDIGAEFAVCPGATEALLDAAISEALFRWCPEHRRRARCWHCSSEVSLQKFFPAELLE